MYLRILIKDLKRKKTMNFIILLFVILASTFFASGVNNMVSIVTGLDGYLDMGGMGDHVALIGEPDGKSPFEDSLRASASVTGWRKESCITASPNNIKVNGEQIEGFSNAAVILAPDTNAFRYFDADDNVIEHVPEGQVYMTNAIAKKAGLKVGDTITIELCGKTFEHTFTGVCKDAAFGSDMMDIPHFLIGDDAYRDMIEDDEIKIYGHSMYYIDTTDETEVSSIISNTDGVRFDAQRSMIKTSYIVNMLIAGVIMAVSLCLIVIAFVVLRFTIGFSISEEFREIGVMKAVGLKNRSIRSLYLVKYFGLSVIGSAIGLITAFPFGDLLLDTVRENMIITNRYGLLINTICCVIVVGVILLFCWGCTAKIKKLSAVDAVRSGQTGERYTRHSAVRLNKTKLGANSFLSINDVTSEPRQTAIVTAVFTLSALLVMVLANTAETLSSDELMYLISVTDSDVYYVNNKYVSDIMGGTKTIADANEEVGRELADNGMDARVHNEAQISAVIGYGDKTTAIRFMYCRDTRAEDYYYQEGYAPGAKDEIAITYPIAAEIGAGIGDTVDVTLNGRTDSFIITALYDTFNGLGKCGRLHQSYEVADSSITNLMGFQIDFADRPSDAVIQERIEELKDIFGTNSVFDKAGFVNDCTKAADAVVGVKDLTLIVAVVIIILMTVLIERSFISKERSQIALMKALGFKSRSVINIHILRFMLICGLSLAAAAALSIPMTKLIMDPIFSIMGATNGISYANDTLGTFLVLPAVIFGAVILASFVTSLYTKTISASDTAAIE